jgi:hypothetical protein
MNIKEITLKSGKRQGDRILFPAKIMVAVNARLSSRKVRTGSIASLTREPLDAAIHSAHIVKDMVKHMFQPEGGKIRY